MALFRLQYLSLLANKTLSIDQLEELAPGKKFILPDNAIRHINILANGKAIAQGELIKIKRYVSGRN